jgi:hypothetical protein
MPLAQAPSGGGGSAGITGIGYARGGGLDSGDDGAAPVTITGGIPPAAWPQPVDQYFGLPAYIEANKYYHAPTAANPYFRTSPDPPDPVDVSPAALNRMRGLPPPTNPGPPRWGQDVRGPSAPLEMQIDAPSSGIAEPASAPDAPPFVIGGSPVATTQPSMSAPPQSAAEATSAPPPVPLRRASGVPQQGIAGASSRGAGNPLLGPIPSEMMGGSDPAVTTSITPAHKGGIGGIPQTEEPHAEDHQGTPSNSDIWETVLAAGLGIMGGRSPFAAVNIGQGGLEGLKFGEELRSRHATEALRSAQEQSNQQYKQSMAETARQRADTGDTRAQAYVQASQARSSELMAQAALAQARAANVGASKITDADIRKQAIDSLIGQPMDPANPDGPKFTKASATSKMFGLDIKEQQADTARLRADNSIDVTNQKLDLLRQDQSWKQQHGDATLAERQRHDNDMRDKGLSDEDIRIYEGGKNPVTGVNATDPATVDALRRKIVPQSQSATPQYIEGKTYVDRNGNKAIYQNGNFVPVP